VLAQKIFGRFLIRPKCMICNCRFSLPSCRATKCKSLAACDSLRERGTPEWVFWASASKRNRRSAREPLIEIIERLIGKDMTCAIYDKNVNMASLVARTATSFSPHSAHIEANGRRSRRGAQSRPDRRDRKQGSGFQGGTGAAARRSILVDFVRVIEGRSKNGHYDGICW